MRTIVHTSDLHFPRVEPRMMASLTTCVNDINPDLVVVSGDLTQRARSSQFLEAATFLQSLTPPVLVVPGNHDVPMFNLAARLVSPFAGYRQYISDELEPVFEDAEVLVVGLNSVRTVPFSDKGRLNAEQAERAAARLRLAPPDVVRIVVTHHPFDVPPGAQRAKMIGRSRMAMAHLSAAGADMFLAGHLHVSHVGDTATRYRIAGHSALLVQAGTMSTRERGEPNSFNVLRLPDRNSVTIERLSWDPSTATFTVRWQGTFRLTSGAWGPYEGDRATV